MFSEGAARPTPRNQAGNGIVVATKDVNMGIKALGWGFARQNYRRDQATRRPTAPRFPSRWDTTSWTSTKSQAIGAAEPNELTGRRCRFDAATVAKIKDAIRWAFDL